MKSKMIHTESCDGAAANLTELADELEAELGVKFKGGPGDLIHGYINQVVRHNADGSVKDATVSVFVYTEDEEPNDEHGATFRKFACGEVRTKKIEKVCKDHKKRREQGD